VVPGVVPDSCVVLAADPAVVAPSPSVVVGAAVLATSVQKQKEFQTPTQ